MPLTDTALRNAKPKEKPYKLGDSQGLFVLVRPTGSKLWRLKYRFNKKEQLLSLGIYPDVSLAKARDRRDECRKLLADGINPSGHRKAAKDDSTPETFETVAREWHKKQVPIWTPKHALNIESRLTRLVYPALGKRPIADVQGPDLLAMLKPLQEDEQYALTSRVLSECKQICDYAVATGRLQFNPAPSVKPALTKVRPTHRAAVTKPKDIGPLLRMLYAYEGSQVVMSALRLAPLVFTRPGELRAARWDDVILDGAKPQWAYRVTKTSQDHIVPLSTQAVEILRELHTHTGHQEYVFPGQRYNGRPMSDNALAVAMRTMGIAKETMSVHGVRAMARTCLDEQLHFPPHLIEHQLAHAVKDPQGRSYNRTSFLPERKAMMQRWANYLDELRNETTA